MLKWLPVEPEVASKFFSLFERKKDYERKTENGTLKISKATINNYVMDLLRKDPDITGIKAVSDLKGNKFLIHIKCELLAKMNVANKISSLQSLIKTDLMENLGVDVNKVTANIVKIEAREKEKVNKKYLLAGEKNDVDKLMSLQEELDELDLKMIEKYQEWEETEEELKDFQ